MEMESATGQTVSATALVETRLTAGILRLLVAHSLALSTTSAVETASVPEASVSAMENSLVLPAAQFPTGLVQITPHAHNALEAALDAFGAWEEDPPAVSLSANAMTPMH
jgi:hypothetical protein